MLIAYNTHNQLQSCLNPILKQVMIFIYTVRA
jgi:hypothetical protein